MSEPTAAEEAKPRPGALRRWLPILARVLVFGLLLGWFFWYADLEAFASAFSRVSLLAFIPALIGSVAINSIGGLRWQVLMRGFGARDLPPLLTTIRLFFVGLFYNTFVPGSFGGDVVRGVVTRRYFDKSVASYMVIFLERTIGFSAMILVFLIGVAIGPEIIDLRAHLPWLLSVLAVGIAVVAFFLFSGRLSSHLERMPRVVKPTNLIWVFALSIISHFIGVTVMYSLVRGMDLPISYPALVIVMPVAFTAAVVPLNVLGVGTREVTLVALFAVLGIETEQAAALSLCYAAVHLGMAGLGGLIQLIQGRVGVGEQREGAEGGSA